MENAQTEIPLTETEEVVGSENLLLPDVKPSDFGVEIAKAVKLQQSFTPFIIEMQSYDSQYAEILNADITPTVCKQARELRLKYVKSRTGITKAHKAEKEFFLAGGRFVDAIKNKGTLSCETREEKLLEVETYFERQEAERLRKLGEERKTELEKYTSEIPSGLGEMLEGVYNMLLSGAKKEYEEKAEKERIKALSESRPNELQPYWDYVSDEAKLFDFGSLSDKEYSAILKLSKKAKSDKEAADLKKQQEDAAELERLRTENAQNAKLQELVILRCSELQGLNMTFDSTTACYVGNGFEIKNTDIQTLTEDDWKSLTHSIKEAYEQTLTIETEPEPEQKPTEEVKTATASQAESIPTTTRRASIINWVKPKFSDWAAPAGMENDPDIIKILVEIKACQQRINQIIIPIKD